MGIKRLQKWPVWAVYHESAVIVLLLIRLVYVAYRLQAIIQVFSISVYKNVHVLDNGVINNLDNC